MKGRLVALIAVTLIGAISVIFWFTITHSLRPVTAEDIREMCEHMSSLFDGKHSLAEIVLITAHKVKNSRLRHSLLRIYNSFKDPNCKPFYELLADYPDIFPLEFRLAVEYASKLKGLGTLLKELAKSWTDDQRERKIVITRILKSLAIRALKDEDWFYRLNAIYALAELDGKNSIPYILPLLKDPEPKVRQQAKKTLQQLGYQVRE